MRKSLKPAIGTLVLLLSLLPGASSAESPQVIVDLDDGTVSPENPTLNIKAIKSLSINLINGPVKPAPSSMLGMPTYERSAGNALRPHRRPLSGYSLTLMLKPCSARPDDAADLPCPFAVVYPEGPAWMVFSDEEIVPVKVAWKADGVRREVAVSVRLAKRRYALDWSVGFSFFEARDREFRIDPISGDPEHAMFTRVSDAGYPYKLGAFAHYSSVRHPALAISAGFAFDVPVDTLTAMAGVTWALRTLPRKNSAYLTTGVAYTQRKELRPEYQKFDDPDSGIVPIGTTPDLLVEDKPTVGAFVALSFGFWGGEEKFKGVYSGKASQ